MDPLFCWIEAHPGLAAWLQGALSIIAIAIAIAVPWWQRRSEIRHAKQESVGEVLSKKARLIAAIAEEIREAEQTASPHYHAAVNTLMLHLAAMRAKTHFDPGPMSRAPLRLTSGVLYQAVAAELGILPPAVLKPIVGFYSSAFNTEHLVSISKTMIEACETMKSHLPRLRMQAAFALLATEKYVRSGFEDDADVSPTPAEVRAAAEAVEYPLEKIMQERGLTPP